VLRAGLLTSAALFAAAAPAHAAAPEFSTQQLTSDTGYATLEWTATGNVALMQAATPDFSAARTIYSGPNHANFISGLPNGTYYFALRDGTGARSRPLQLTVTHQSLTKALWLTAIGFIVFLSVVAVIFRGARDDK
jgi:hypothetical protein